MSVFEQLALNRDIACFRRCKVFAVDLEVPCLALIAESLLKAGTTATQPAGNKSVLEDHYLFRKLG
jgi:hypothetical protein